MQNILRFVWATLRGKSVATMLRSLARPHPVQGEGLEHLPAESMFVLALNHFSDGASGALVVAAFDAVTAVRPELAERVLMVGGRRERPSRRWLAALFARAGARLARWVRDRWSEHFVVIAMEGARADWGALRQWKRRVHERWSVVFPEGIAGYELGAVRPGAGRWLANIGVPTIPCAVWFDGERWRVRVGPMIRWSGRSALHDAQIGLAIAAILPEYLQGKWALDLARVRALRDARAAVNAADDRSA